MCNYINIHHALIAIRVFACGNWILFSFFFCISFALFPPQSGFSYFFLTKVFDLFSFPHTRLFDLKHNSQLNLQNGFQIYHTQVGVCLVRCFYLLRTFGLPVTKYSPSALLLFAVSAVIGVICWDQQLTKQSHSHNRIITNLNAVVLCRWKRRTRRSWKQNLYKNMWFVMSPELQTVLSCHRINGYFFVHKLVLFLFATL